MSDDALDQDAWLARIGYRGPRAPTLETLAGLVTAQAMSIAYESIDVLLDRPPRLDLASNGIKPSPIVIASRRLAAWRSSALSRVGGHWIASLRSQ